MSCVVHRKDVRTTKTKTPLIILRFNFCWCPTKSLISKAENIIAFHHKNGGKVLTFVVILYSRWKLEAALDNISLLAATPCDTPLDVSVVCFDLLHIAPNV